MADRGLNPERDRAFTCLTAAGASAAAVFALALVAAFPAAVIARHGITMPVLGELAGWLPAVFSQPASWLGIPDGHLARWIVRDIQTLGYPPPALLGAIAAGFAGGLAAGLCIWRRTGPHNFSYTSHGAARFATDKDLRRASLFDQSGILLGRWGDAKTGKLLRNRETLSVQIVSPPGTGKTVHLISHILADHPDRARIPGPSLVINDPKGEIYKETAGWRSTLGPVYYLRWTDMEGTAWNPLSRRNMTDGELAMQLRLDLVDELDLYYAAPRAALNTLLAQMRDHDASWVRNIRKEPQLLGALKAVKNPKFSRAFVQKARSLSASYAVWEAYVDRLATVAVPDVPGHQHWVVSGRSALAGFLFYEMASAEREGEEPSFGHMLEWLSNAGIEELDGKADKNNENSDLTAKLLDAAIQDAREHGYPTRTVTELASLRSKPDKERGSIISTAIGKLNIFRNVAIRSRTSRSDFTFSDLRGSHDGRPVTVYFDIPLEDAESLGIPTGMFMQGAAAYLISQDQKEARTRPVQFLLDEFWTLPPLSAITQIPALGRGQWVQIMIIGQSNSQIADKLGDKALDILKSAIARKLYFTLNDPGTAKEVSEVIGQRTVHLEQTSKTTGLGSGMGDAFRRNRSVSIQGLPLIRPEEMMSLEKLDPEDEHWGELVVLVQGMQNRPIGGPGQPCHPVIYFLDEKLKRRAKLRRAGFIEGPRGVALLPTHMPQRDVFDEEDGEEDGEHGPAAPPTLPVRKPGSRGHGGFFGNVLDMIASR